jgi:hypothetical protein
MMASLFSELYTWVNAQTWIPGPIAFDVFPEDPGDPYYTMSPVSDEGNTGEFCFKDSGRTVIEFNGYGSDKVSLYDAMDKLRTDLIGARNKLTEHSLWYLRMTGVVGFQTEDVRMYRYAFTMETVWGLK